MIYGFIYCATADNGKRYVGQTSCIRALNDPIEYLHSRYQLNEAHNEHFERALRKHDFQWEVLRTCLSQEELDECERAFIAQFQTTNKAMGYNKREGGHCGGKLSMETREKISISTKAMMSQLYEKMSALRKGVPKTFEWKMKVSKALKGKPKSVEHREKIGKAHKGRKWGPEFCAKVSEAKKGKKRSPHSEETKKKMSDAAKRRWAAWKISTQG